MHEELVMRQNLSSVWLAFNGAGKKDDAALA